MERYHFKELKVKSKVKENNIERLYAVRHEDEWIDLFFDKEVNEQLFEIVAQKDDNLTVDMLKHIHQDERLNEILKKYYDGAGWLVLPKDKRIIKECHEVIMAFIRRLNAEGTSISWVWEEKIIDLTIPPTKRQRA